MDPLRWTIFTGCPTGGPCRWLQDYIVIFFVVLVVEGLIFASTLIPPIFSWRGRKPDGKKRIIFAIVACVTFYIWLTFLIISSVFCFGFIAHEGPCKMVNMTADGKVGGNETVSDQETATLGVAGADDSVDEEAIPAFSNGSIFCGPSWSAHDMDLLYITIVNCLIVVVLLIVLAANALEALTAKALHHNETLCKSGEVRNFLSSLCKKPPEVGHLVTCFHYAKPSDKCTSDCVSVGSNENAANKKIVTFSAIENFHYHNWKDCSEIMLTEPSSTFPIIEIEVTLNYFPGDHPTADKYKAFVLQLTKQHSGKDAKINIDDYFHIEDHREWTFFVGNSQFISPWWDRGFGKYFVSCCLLFGWPFRLCYNGEIAKHKIEIKKSVKCEIASQDEGVSLSATPGTSSNETGTGTGAGAGASISAITAAPPHSASVSAATTDSCNPAPSTRDRQKVVDPVGASTSSPQANPNPPPPYQLLVADENNASANLAKLSSPRSYMHETTKDIVTAVTHKDINGMSTVNTIALKDIDVQMTQLCGYETYV